MALSDVVNVFRQAAADAALADGLYDDPAFRSALRSDRDDTLRVFTVTSLASDGRGPRPLPRSWRLRFDARSRPVL